MFFYAAQRLLDGGAPYRDVWDHKPPGVYFVDALGLALDGRTGVWLVQLAFLAAAAVVGYRALRREFGDGPAFVGSLAWLVSSPRLFLERGQTSFVEFFALPLQFGAMLLYTRPLTWRRALGIGVLGGAAFLFKPTLVGIWLAIGLVTLVTSRGKALAPLTLIASGALIPLATVGAWAAARGVLGDMVDQTLVYNRAYSAFASLSDRVDAVLAGLRLTLPTGLAIVAIGAWTYAVLRRRSTPPLLSIALVAFPLELALATLGRGYHYYFMAWLPAMGVLAAFAACELQRAIGMRRSRLVLAIAVLAMSAQPALLVTRLAGLGDDGRIRAAAMYVAANTSPEDTVLVWGSSTEVLFLAGRRSPTRYVYQYAALATRGYATPARVDELLADLERARPALIVDGSAGGFVTPPLDPAGFRAYVSPEPQYSPLPEIERIVTFVRANYERAGAEPATGWPVWRLRP